ncbi:hypothetical protein SPB21_07520 [Leptothoe sp. ISB3NOV94-8A]|uniref:Uncharacterized protein n=1 Tax=Adonisia turfae CCMR0081 TaxID=2292702 RepID=A0A6M0RMM2_9CYAN|nr:hypothetical protein [Adonisia turfae]NEZ57517.1 hypothetical protein [Adonisia turfae CCMR0081]
MNKLTGRVQTVKTKSNDNAIVVIDSTSHGNLPPKGTDGPLDNYFYFPGSMTEDQLSEFKRAQGSNLGVTVEFENDRVIDSIVVF